MLQKFFKYIFQSMAGMLGISVYILADTYFISVYSGADGLAVLNLILPVYGLIYAIGAMIGIGSATRYAIDRARGKSASFYFLSAVPGIFSSAFRWCWQAFSSRIKSCSFSAQTRG